MPEPLIVSAPYPTTDGLCHDVYSLGTISKAYASPTGELNSILQYVYHSFFFANCGRADISDTLINIAVAEMLHLNLLGKTILALGASPVFAQYPATGFNFYSAKYVAYSSSLKDMLEDDVLGERRAIACYLKMLKNLHDENVAKIISRILEDEKLHLRTLEEILREFKG